MTLISTDIVLEIIKVRVDMTSGGGPCQSEEYSFAIIVADHYVASDWTIKRTFDSDYENESDPLRAASTIHDYGQ